MIAAKKKAVSRRVEIIRPQQIIRSLSLREFYQKRNKVLIIRAVGGLGDILMHRMIFEDFKRIMPDAELHFACPRYYHDAVSDHPFIDKIVAVEDVKKEDYIVSYNTTTACGRTEIKLAPYSAPHRSDIWAEYCGVILTNHNMHFRLSDQEKEIGKRLIESYRNREGPVMLISPISAMQNKNLLDHQLETITKGLKDRGFCIIGLHNNPIDYFFKNNIPVIVERKLRSWMGIINQADYVLSVDTATLHCAGGMERPTVGVFTFANGLVYSKYYKNCNVIQGPCPAGYSGCYNWGLCPVTDKSPKPCLTDINADNILLAVDKMTAK